MASLPEQSPETEALRTATPAIPDVEPGATPPGRIRREAFRALRYRNFRLLFIGTILSQTGDFLQIMAQGQATKIILPTELAGLAGAITGITEAISVNGSTEPPPTEAEPTR